MPAAARGLGLAARFALIAMHAEERATIALVRAPARAAGLPRARAPGRALLRRRAQGASCPSMRCCGSCRRPTPCAGPRRFVQLLDVCAGRGRASLSRSGRGGGRGCAMRWPPRARSMPARSRNAHRRADQGARRAARIAAITHALAAKPASRRRRNSFRQGKAPNDRSLYLDHPQRPQGFDHARRARPAVSRACDQHRQERTVHAGVRGDQPRTARSRRSSIRTAPTASRIAMMESGAILRLSRRQDRPVSAAPIASKYDALQWLMFQMGGVGPMFGQVHHFLRAAPEPVPYAIERYIEGNGASVRRAGPASRRRRISRRTNIRSPTSPPIRGLRGTNGTRRIWPTFPT